MRTGERPERHVLQELGFTIAPVGEELHGTAAIVAEMWVPGTDVLRTSILASWADQLTGLLAVTALAGPVPVTLELDVHLYEPHHGTGRITGVGRLLKAGRAVIVAGADFTDAAGRPVATATATFMASPDRELRMPPGDGHLEVVAEPGGPLPAALAERAGCERSPGGVATLPRTDEGLNASGTVNGGLLALVAEEAVLSDAPGCVLATMAMRFLRPVRVGPAVARARLHAGVGRVQVTDEGRNGALAVLVTTRTWPAGHYAA